jgi:hypothetical protein
LFFARRKYLHHLPARACAAAPPYHGVSISNCFK